MLADVFALYLKTKNFHWHISGRLGTYKEAVHTGNLLFLSGMLPTEGFEAKFDGHRFERKSASCIFRVFRIRYGSIESSSAGSTFIVGLLLAQERSLALPPERSIARPEQPT